MGSFRYSIKSSQQPTAGRHGPATAHSGSCVIAMYVRSSYVPHSAPRQVRNQAGRCRFSVQPTCFRAFCNMEIDPKEERATWYPYVSVSVSVCRQGRCLCVCMCVCACVCRCCLGISIVIAPGPLPHHLFISANVCTPLPFSFALSPFPNSHQHGNPPKEPKGKLHLLRLSFPPDAIICPKQKNPSLGPANMLLSTRTGWCRRSYFPEGQANIHGLGGDANTRAPHGPP